MSTYTGVAFSGQLFPSAPYTNIPQELLVSSLEISGSPFYFTSPYVSQAQGLFVTAIDITDNVSLNSSGTYFQSFPINVLHGASTIEYHALPYISGDTGTIISLGENLDFYALNNIGPIGTEVRFLSYNGNPENTINWDFGDGGSGVGHDVTYTYSGIGVFDVTSSASGIESFTKSRYVIIDDLLISASPTTGSSPLSVDFTLDYSELFLPSTTWTLESGVTATDVLSTNHVFTGSAGTYTVTLESSYKGFTWSDTQDIIIEVAGVSNPFNIFPILNNQRISPYSNNSTDIIQLKLDVLSNQRLINISGLPIELYFNYNGTWEKQEDYTTTRYGNKIMYHSCSGVPSGVNNCVSYARVAVDGELYNSNVIRVNFT